MSDVKENIQEQAAETNKFEIARSKGFSYINYLKITSTILVNEASIAIKYAYKWFYFITGKTKEVSIENKSISNIEVKTSFSFWDLLDLFKNPVGSLTSLPTNVNFLTKFTFVVIFKRLLFRN